MDTEAANDKDLIIKELQNKVNYLMVKCGAEKYNSKYVKCCDCHCDRIDIIDDNKEYINKHNISLQFYFCDKHRYCLEKDCAELRYSGYSLTCSNHDGKCLKCGTETSGWKYKYHCIACTKHY